MNITFSPGFYKSLKKVIRHEMWFYKIYDVLRYGIKNYIYNMWKFRKELYQYRSWDSMYSLTMFRRGLELLCDNIEKNGLEIDESRLKKVEKMKRAIELMKYHEYDSFINLAEKQIGREVDLTYFLDDEPEEIANANREIFQLSEKIEKDSLDELFQILKGQEPYNSKTTTVDNWNDYFDGSGIKGWWD